MKTLIKNYDIIGFCLSMTAFVITVVKILTIVL